MANLKSLSSPSSDTGADKIFGSNWNDLVSFVKAEMPAYATISVSGTTINAYKHDGTLIDSGIFNTDTGNVINSALTSISNNGGGKLFFKKASSAYACEETLLVPANTIIDGGGWGTALKVKDSTNVDLIRNLNWGSSLDEGIIIRNITLSGGSSQQSSTTIDVISFNQALRPKVLQCVVKDSKRFGIRIVTNGVAELAGCKVTNCGSSGISFGSGADDSQITDCDIGSNTGNGISFSSVANCSMTGGSVFLNTGIGIDMSASERVSITGVKVHDNGSSGIRVAGGASNNVADDNVIVGNSLSSNNNNNSSADAEVLIVANASVKVYGTVVSGNTIFVDQSNSTGIKEYQGNIDYSVLTSNSIRKTAGTHITTLGANTVNANNSTRTG